MQAKPRDLALFGLLAAAWGGSFVAIKYVVGAYPPVFGAMLRVGTALAILLAVFLAERRSLSVDSGTRARMWVAGVFAQGLPFGLLFWGERLISPGLAGIINGTVPIWTLLLGAVSGAGETITRRKAAGLVLGLSGLAVIFAPLIVFGGTRGEIMGVCAVTVMAVSYATGGLLTKALMSGERKADFRANLVHQHCASLAFLVAATALLEPWPSAGELARAHAALGATLYLGAISTAAAFFVYYHLIREWGAVRASAVTYVAPVFALFWDFLFFRNTPRPSEAAGVAAILAGVVVLNSSAGSRASRTS